MKVKMPKPLSISKMDEIIETLTELCRKSEGSESCVRYKDCFACPISKMFANAHWCKKRLAAFEHIYHAYATFRNAIPRIEYLIHDELPDAEYDYE